MEMEDMRITEAYTHKRGVVTTRVHLRTASPLSKDPIYASLRRLNALKINCAKPLPANEP